VAEARDPFPAQPTSSLVNTLAHPIKMRSGTEHRNVEGPATVAQRASVDAGVLAIEVCDNGPGFPLRFTLNGDGGHGLRNVAEQASRFFRISRAAIINLNGVGEVYPLPSGSGEVLMKNGQRREVRIPAKPNSIPG
jgi:hypothetical protein